MSTLKNYSFRILLNRKQQSLDSFGILVMPALRLCNNLSQTSSGKPVEARAFKSNLLAVKSHRRQWFNRDLKRIAILISPLPVTSLSPILIYYYLFIICSQNVTYILQCTKRAGQQGTDNRH